MNASKHSIILDKKNFSDFFDEVYDDKPLIMLWEKHKNSCYVNLKQVDFLHNFSLQIVRQLASKYKGSHIYFSVVTL